MNIYNKFVYPEKLVSPDNGYICRRITKQNIRNFGFSSVDELRLKYPDFPLSCSDFSIKNSEAIKRGIKDTNLEKSKRFEKTRQSRELIYFENPNICDRCGNIKDYKRRNNMFCSRSCANRQEHRSSTKLSISNALRLHFSTVCDVNFRECNECKKLFTRSTTLKNNKTSLCKVCLKKLKKYNPKILYVGEYTKVKPCLKCGNYTKNYFGRHCNNCISTLSEYRNRASFTFNVFDYPGEFDLGLIESYGFYSPNGYKRRNKTPNHNGVSRDHMISVSFAFKTNVDPDLISHPANCRIMKHNGVDGNNSKKGNSSITLDELLIRIIEWDNKYGVYTKVSPAFDHSATCPG